MGRHAPLRPAPSEKFLHVPPIPAWTRPVPRQKTRAAHAARLSPAEKYAHIPMKIHHFPLLEQCLLLEGHDTAKPCRDESGHAGGVMKSLFNSQIGLVGRVMNMQLQRQNVIMSNLANVETPNYKPREIEFEKELQSALGLDMRGRMSITSQGHMPAAFNPDNFGPEWSKQFKPRQIHGEDRVHLDKEMAKHAKNQLQYTALTQVMTKSFEGLSTIIQDGKQY